MHDIILNIFYDSKAIMEEISYKKKLKTLVCLKIVRHTLKCQACLKLALGFLLVLNCCDSCTMQISQHLSSHIASSSQFLIFFEPSILGFKLISNKSQNYSVQQETYGIPFQADHPGPHPRPQIPFWDITSFLSYMRFLGLLIRNLSPFTTVTGRCAFTFFLLPQVP